jgi:hypothetical protein
MRSQQDIDNIIQEVQTKLDAYQKRTGISLRVPKDGYIQDDPWLNVVVTPTSPGVRAHQYVDALEELEKELRKNGHKDVLLVPALAN